MNRKYESVIITKLEYYRELHKVSKTQDVV